MLSPLCAAAAHNGEGLCKTRTSCKEWRDSVAMLTFIFLYDWRQLCANMRAFSLNACKNANANSCCRWYSGKMNARVGETTPAAAGSSNSVCARYFSPVTIKAIARASK